MNLNKLTITFALTLLLTACGGSGGGNSNNTGNGESNNTSSTEIVFGDSLNSSWGKFTAYEWSNTSNSGFNYDNGQTANFLHWKIVQSSSAEHNSVIELDYATDQDSRWAQFYITPATPTDLSKYETGTFSFDINVLDWGDAYDSATGTATFEVHLECGWPCASHAVHVIVDKKNQWQKVSINVSAFTESGADLTKLDGTFLIRTPFNKQKGTRYQLDNIKWTKGTTTAIKKKVTYEEHFNTYASKDNWVFVPVDGILAPPYAIAIADGLLVVASINNVGAFNSWALETTLAKTINIAHKKIKIQFLVDESLVGSSNLEFIATDVNGYIAYTPRVFTNTFKPNDWNQVSFDVDTTDIVADNLFDPNAVKKLKIALHTNGQTYARGVGVIEMDEILITE